MLANAFTLQGPRRALVLLLSLLLALGGAVAAAHSEAPETPQATIRTITTDVLAVLKANRDTLDKQPAALTPRIAAIVDPYLDFKLMSEEVLGIGWRRADDRQRRRFTQAFHALLNADYAAVYKQYNGQRIRVTQARWTDAAHDRAVVSSAITSPGSQPIAVDYRMHRAGGRWKVYDVVVDGVSLLINYRNAFRDELQHENLDALIARIEAKASGQGATSP